MTWKKLLLIWGGISLLILGIGWYGLNRKTYGGFGIASPYIVVAQSSGRPATTTRFIGTVSPKETAKFDLGEPAYSWNDVYASGTIQSAEVCIAGDCKTAWPTGGGGGSAEGWSDDGTTISVTTSTRQVKAFQTITAQSFAATGTGIGFSTSGTIAVAGTATSTFAGHVSSTGFIASNGTHGDPAFSFSGDLNTGIHQQGIGVLELDAPTQINLDVNNGGTRLVFDADQFMPVINNQIDLGSYSNSFRNLYASGTAVLGGVTSTRLAITGLTSCNGKLATDANGNVFCGTDQSGGGGTSPFTDPGSGTVYLVTSTNNVVLWGDITAKTIHATNTAGSFFASGTSALQNVWAQAVTTTGNIYPKTANTASIGVLAFPYLSAFIRNLAVRNITDIGGQTASSTVVLSGRSGEINTAVTPRPTSTQLTINGFPRTLPAFNASTTNCIYWGPEYVRDAWDGRQIAPEITSFNASGTGVFVWELYAESVTSGTKMGVFTGSPAYATTTATSQAYTDIETNFTLLTVGSAATGTPMQFKLCRDAGQAGDTLGGEAFANSLKIEMGLAQYSD